MLKCKREDALHHSSMLYFYKVLKINLLPDIWNLQAL
jgi:hypothetical protein